MAVNEGILKKPVELISELGLLDLLHKRKKGKTSAIEALKNRAIGFEWVHLGTTDIEIGKLLSVIEKTPYLIPPRTGHIGNWDQIARGRSGMMDFNNAICSKGYGYPLLYCFNQTESNEKHGDWVYLPGSIVMQDKRVELPLYTWDGEQFIKRTRESPLFTPFVLTEFEGSFIPLIQVHKHQYKQFKGFEFRLETTVLYENISLLKEILYELLDNTSRQENPRSLFQDILSHQVTLGGEMYRANILRDGDGYRMGEVFYLNLDELVEAATLPLQAIHEPELFFNKINSLPTHMPLISNVLMRMLSAIFCTHYPDSIINRQLMTQPFNPHFHWGARDMAGYPPRKKGYFSTKSKIRNYKRICSIIINKFPEIDPLFIVLIPAVVFSLCPTNIHEKDSKLVAKLIARVKYATDSLIGQENEMMIKIEKITKEWLSEVRSDLSDYFLKRFVPGSGIVMDKTLHDYSLSIEPEGFRCLTFRQACMIVGALIELV